MTIAEMFTQSGAVALLGMAVVFFFLIIMIVVITLAGRVISSLGLNREAPAAACVPPVSSGVDGAVVAAITAAVKAHHKR